MRILDCQRLLKLHNINFSTRHLLIRDARLLMELLKVPKLGPGVDFLPARVRAGWDHEDLRELLGKHHTYTYPWKNSIARLGVSDGDSLGGGTNRRPRTSRAL